MKCKDLQRGIRWDLFGIARFHSLALFLDISCFLCMIEDEMDSLLVQGHSTCCVVESGPFVAKPTEIETSIWAFIVQLPTL